MKHTLITLLFTLAGCAQIEAPVAQIEADSGTPDASPAAAPDVPDAGPCHCESYIYQTDPRDRYVGPCGEFDSYDREGITGVKGGLLACAPRAVEH